MAFPALGSPSECPETGPNGRPPLVGKPAREGKGGARWLRTPFAPGRWHAYDPGVVNRNLLNPLGLVCFLWLAAVLPGLAEMSAVEPPATDPESAGPAAIQLPPVENPLFPQAAQWTKVRQIKVHGEISLSTSAYVKRAIQLAEKEKANAFLIDLETFGGRVDAAIQIRDLLVRSKIPTAVYVNPRAISAGALISLASDRIVMAPGGTIGAAAPIQMAPGGGEAKPVGEKYVSYFRQEMRATAELKGRNGDIAEAMVDAEKVVEGLNEKGKLVTLTTEQAIKWKMADAVASSPEEFYRQLGMRDASVPKEIETTWSEGLAGFLTSQAISSLLFIIMLVSAYLEYQTPGFGVFGFIALSCFAILFFAHYLTGLASYTELVIFVIGVALLVIELIAMPGFGFVGLAGMLAIMASLVLMLVGSGFVMPDITNAVTRLIWSSGIAIVCMLLLARLLPRQKTAGGAPVPSGLILGTELQAGSGDSAAYARDLDLKGRRGEAVTVLRPSGRVKIGGEEYMAQTEGDFIDRGAAIEVIRVDGAHIWVKAAPEGKAA